MGAIEGRLREQGLELLAPPPGVRRPFEFVRVHMIWRTSLAGPPTATGH